MKEQPHRYHIHITSEDKKPPRGFKLTSVILEKRKVIQEHNMFTRTFVGTADDNIVYGGSASSWDNCQICEDFETYEDYISGNYTQGIILDKQRHKNLEAFLEEKRVLDHERAKEKHNKLYRELQEKYKKEIK